MSRHAPDLTTKHLTRDHLRLVLNQKEQQIKGSMTVESVRLIKDENVILEVD